MFLNKIRQILKLFKILSYVIFTIKTKFVCTSTKVNYKITK